MTTMKLNGAGTYCALAGANLTDKRHYFAKVDSAGAIVLAGSGEAVLGSIFEDGASGAPITVQTNGNGKVICGATVAAGAEIQSDGSGKAITLAGGKRVGMALNGGLVNELIEFAFDK